jgi:hypothetical protein
VKELKDMTERPRHAPQIARPIATPIARLAALPTALALATALWCASNPAAAAPILWGYGVKTCGDYVAAAPGDGAPVAVVGAEYLRYREWLAGLVSGLNLATGTDVLAGGELDAALTRIQAYCRTHPADDFFNASMALVRSLGQVKGTRGKGKKD